MSSIEENSLRYLRATMASRQGGGIAANVAAQAKRMACYGFLAEHRDSALFQGVAPQEFCRFVDGLEHYLLYLDLVEHSAPHAHRVKRLRLAATDLDSMSESSLPVARMLASRLRREQQNLSRET